MKPLMRAWLILAAIILSSAVVIAQETVPAGYEYRGSIITGNYWFKMIISVLFIASVAFIAVKLMKKYKITSLPFGAKEGLQVKVLDTKNITPDKKVMKAEIDGKTYILALTKDSISVLDKQEKKKGKK